MRKNSEISERYSDNFVNIIEELRIYKWVNISPGCVLEKELEKTPYLDTFHAWQGCNDLADRIKCLNNYLSPSIQTIKDKCKWSLHFNFDFIFTENFWNMLTKVIVKKVQLEKYLQTLSKSLKIKYWYQPQVAWIVAYQQTPSQMS